MKAILPAKRISIPQPPLVLGDSHEVTHKLLKPLLESAENSNYLIASSIGEFTSEDQTYHIPRFIFMGDRSGGDTTRLAILASFYGDEPEGAEAVVHFLQELERWPDLARGYHIYAYPICNPTGLREGKRTNFQGVELPQQFWNKSSQPEVYYLERELGVLNFHGVISLQAGKGSPEFRVHTRSKTLAITIGEPVLQAAQKWLPARSYPVSPSPFAPVYITDTKELRNPPFEIVLQTPGSVSRHTQITSTVAALKGVLDAYRTVLSFSLNL